MCVCAENARAPEGMSKNNDHERMYKGVCVDGD